MVVLKGEVQYRARGGEEAELARLSSLAQQHLIMLHDAHAQAQVTTGEDEAAAARALDSALGPTFATHPAGSLHRELALLGQDTLATESLVAAAPTEVRACACPTLVPKSVPFSVALVGAVVFTNKA